MKNLQIEITGVSPLMLDAFTDKAAQLATAGSSSSVRAAEKESPLAQAEARLYKDEHGHPVMPTPNLFRCIIEAGRYYKSGKRQLTTAQSSQIPGCVAIRGMLLPLISTKPWRVDERPVRNPTTGGRFLVYRPVFDDWKLTFDVELDDGSLGFSEKLFRSVVDQAGKAIGLGTFRPERKGPFGRFVVTSWKEIAE